MHDHLAYQNEDGNLKLDKKSYHAKAITQLLWYPLHASHGLATLAPDLTTTTLQWH